MIDEHIKYDDDLEVTDDGRITFSLRIARKIAKSSGLRSKKPRKVKKRFKKEIQRMLREGIDESIHN